METILLTGGAGFIGSNLVRYWLAKPGFRLIVLDKFTYAGNRASLPAESHRLQIVRGDICDRALVEQLLKRHQPRAVVHLAAESHVDRSIDGPAEFVETNVVGTCNLLDRAWEYFSRLPTLHQSRFRFLHVSTDEVYGSLGETGLFREDSRFAPNSPYAASKASSDLFVRAYHKTFGLPTLVSNCSNNYGPYQFPEKLIPLMLLNALEGKPLPVYGDGKQVRDWLFVEDHCRALDVILREGKTGETYNIGGNCERTNLQVVETICDLIDGLTDRPPTASRNLISFVTDRPGHDRRYAIDPSKVRDQLGWQPQFSFESALRETVNWYFDNLAWVDEVGSKSNYAIRIGLRTPTAGDGNAAAA